MSIVEDLREKGWAYEPFGLDESALAEYALAARLIIEVALENEAVRDALTPGDDKSLGLSTYRTPGLDQDKETIQLDSDSELRAGIRMNTIRQPSELRSFWPLHREMLGAVVDCARSSFADIDMPVFSDKLLGDDVPDRTVLIRTNWYKNALKYENEESREILSGHADRGAFTLHLYETHGGFLKGAAYNRSDVGNPDAIAKMVERLAPVEPRDGEAVVFLGAGWWNVSKGLVPYEHRDLPALYHVADQPPQSEVVMAPTSSWVTGGKPDRLSVVSFIDPPRSMVAAGHYKPATREVARPTIMFTESTNF